MKTIYELQSENLTNLGGMMGTEYTYDNYRKYFTSIKAAKSYANKEFEKKASDYTRFRWKKLSNGIITSGDRGYVMYNIREVKIEK